MGVSIRTTKACLERKKPTPEEMVISVAPPQDSNGATRRETIGALKDRSGNRRLAVGHQQPKKRTQADRGSRKKLTAPPPPGRRMTPRTIRARPKGRSHKGRTVERRRRTKLKFKKRHKGPSSETAATSRKREGIQQNPRTEGREASSRVFHWAARSDWTL
jgi:hypothetical protein